MEIRFIKNPQPLRSHARLMVVAKTLKLKGFAKNTISDITELVERINLLETLELDAIVLTVVDTAPSKYIKNNI